MEKYYTPDISDLFVGYECEWYKEPEETTDILFKNRVEYEKWMLNECPFFEPKTLDINALCRMLRSAFPARTPYLTSEQILAEGWDEAGNKGLYHLEWGTINDNGSMKVFLIISREVGAEGKIQCFYSGQCPSINEFRKICKLLGI